MLADAGHNLSDVGGLVVSLVAFWMQKKVPDQLFTYGFKKATVLAAFINSVLLLLAVALIVFECIEKFRVGSIACGSAIMITAGIGILINGLTVALLAKGKEKDINIKSAYLHMLADALVSLGTYTLAPAARMPWVTAVNRAAAISWILVIWLVAITQAADSATLVIPSTSGIHLSFILLFFRPRPIIYKTGAKTRNSDLMYS